jgi:hypothetical protein
LECLHYRRLTTIHVAVDANSVAVIVAGDNCIQHRCLTKLLYKPCIITITIIVMIIIIFHVYSTKLASVGRHWKIPTGPPNSDTFFIAVFLLEQLHRNFFFSYFKKIFTIL